MKLISVKIFYLLALFCFPLGVSAQTQPVIGVALGGGGALGYAHIGVLKVLEENNIPVHLVGGTSAGAIVGGLYALGYRPSQIEEMLGQVDYISIIDDRAIRQLEDPRSKLNPWHKMLGLSYFYSEGRARRNDFSVFKARLIDIFFDKLYWDSGHYASFNEFPRPFVAIGTDAVTNSKVVFKGGSLAKAVRASMAIPFIVSPEYYRGHAVVDGGIVDNLPVEEVYNLGADVVIAVNLSQERKDDSTNALDLFFQARIVNDAVSKQLANVVITPNLKGYNIASFSKFEEIVALGEEATRQALPELLKYANTKSENVIIDKPFIADPLINQVEVVGVSDPKFFERLLNLKLPAKMSRSKAFKETEHLAKHLFVSQMHLYYRGDTLFIELREDNGIQVGLNLGYNTDFGPHFLGGIEIKHKDTLSLFFQTQLGLMQGLDSRGFFYLFPEKFPYFNYLFQWQLNDNFGVGKRYPDGSILPTRRLPNRYQVGAGVAFSFSNYLYVSAVYQYQYINTNTVLDPFFYNNIENEHNTSVKEEIVIDYLDENRYARSGLKAFLRMEQAVPPTKQSYYRLYSGLRGAIPLPKGFSIGLETEGGVLLGNKPSQMSYFTLGGLYTEDDRAFLHGFSLNSVKGRSIWLFRGNIMYTYFSRFHIIPQWNGAWVNSEFDNFFMPNNFYQATGVRIALDLTPFLVEGNFFWNLTEKNFVFSLILGSSY